MRLTELDTPQTLKSARLLERPRPRFALRFIAIAAVVLGLASMLLPWQQTVNGRGEVTALRPADRPQTVPAIIGGQITEWLVAEGQHVTKGTPIARIAEVKEAYLDPQLLMRYREQLAAKLDAIAAKEAKVAALKQQIAALTDQRAASLEKARNDVALKAAAIDAALADSSVAADQLRRRDELQQSGLVSLNDLQSANLRAQQAFARIVEKRRDLSSAESTVRLADAEYADKTAKASAERSATLAEVSEGAAEVSKLRTSLANFEARNALYTITAPQDGIVIQAMRTGVGEQLKEGDPVITIMPTHTGAAVALQVAATDVPLLSIGRKVRLQFDGWPALQFSGWPSAAVGTFGGVVAVIDQVAQLDGTYRVLVAPDTADAPWPEQLRQGSGVLGWAMLDEVRLGYELWRRLNGFPPSMRQPVSRQPGAGQPAAGQPVTGQSVTGQPAAAGAGGK